MAGALFFPKKQIQIVYLFYHVTISFITSMACDFIFFVNFSLFHIPNFFSKSNLIIRILTVPNGLDKEFN